MNCRHPDPYVIPNTMVRWCRVCGTLIDATNATTEAPRELGVYVKAHALLSQRIGFAVEETLNDHLTEPDGDFEAAWNVLDVAVRTDIRQLWRDLIRRAFESAADVAMLDAEKAIDQAGG